MQDIVSKSERYGKEASKYGELAERAEPDYLAAVFRKVVVRYVFMAENLLRRTEAPGRLLGSRSG